MIFLFSSRQSSSSLVYGHDTVGLNSAVKQREQRAYVSHPCGGGITPTVSNLPLLLLLLVLPKLLDVRDRNLVDEGFPLHDKQIPILLESIDDHEDDVVDTIIFAIRDAM